MGETPSDSGERFIGGESVSRDIPISAYTRYLTKDISFHQPLASQCKCSNHYLRFEGQPGEQATMFFMDPSGNPLEFKAFQNVERQ